MAGSLCTTLVLILRNALTCSERTAWFMQELQGGAWASILQLAGRQVWDACDPMLPMSSTHMAVACGVCWCVSWGGKSRCLYVADVGTS